MNTPRTPHRHLPTNQWRRGITLIEVMVTMAIVATILGASVYMVRSLNATVLKDESNKLISTIKYTYAQAAMTNSRYRLVLDLDNNTYGTEVTQSALVKKSEPSEEDDSEFLTEEARKLGKRKKEEDSLFSKEEADPFGLNRKVSYQRVQDSVLKPGKFKSGVKIKRVYVGQQDAVESGKAYVSFYPSGFQDPALIILEDQDERVMTLKLEPLTGRVITTSKEEEPDRDFGQGESDD